MAACPSVRMEQLNSYWMDFHEIVYLKILQKNGSSLIKILQEQRVFYMKTNRTESFLE